MWYSMEIVMFESQLAVQEGNGPQEQKVYPKPKNSPKREFQNQLLKLGLYLTSSLNVHVKQSSKGPFLSLSNHSVRCETL